MEERTRQMKLKMNKYKPGAGSDSRLEQDYHKVTRFVHKLWVCASLPTAAATYDVLFAWMRSAIWCISQAVRHEHTHISTTYCAHKLIKTYQRRKTLNTTVSENKKKTLHDSSFCGLSL